MLRNYMYEHAHAMLTEKLNSILRDLLIILRASISSLASLLATSSVLIEI